MLDFGEMLGVQNGGFSVSEREIKRKADIFKDSRDCCVPKSNFLP